MVSAALSSGLLSSLLVAALALLAVARLQGAYGRAPRSSARVETHTPDPLRIAGDRDQSVTAGDYTGSGSSDAFLADISHELRTPLVALLGYVELLGETQLGRHQRDYTSAIANAGGNLLDIVDDLTSLSRIETGQVAVHEQPLSVHDCIDGVAQMLALSAYHKGLDLIRIVDADVPATVQGDPLRLRQVLVNLVTNAIKFTRDGYVQIRVDVIRSSAARTELEFAVTDTGIGIAAEDQLELFRPFARVKRAADAQGTGLGLVITKRLCELMQGTLTLESEVDKGSRFAVRIPFRTDPETSAAMTFPTVLTGRNVLLHCANDALAEWLSDCLVRHGGFCERTDIETVLATTDLEMYDLALIFVGQGLLADPDRLASLGAAVRERVNVICLVGTGSGYSLQRVERMFGGEALPAHAPIAAICERIAELANTSVPRPQVDAAAQSKLGTLQGMRLLVAEDNTVSRDYLRIMLSQHGAVVAVCCDGNEAIELIQRNTFDAVLMDARMPGCDGSTAARRLRAAGHTLPVIGLTAAAAECEQARAAGMDECLVKPLRTEELVQTIANVHRMRTAGPIIRRDFLDEEMLTSLKAELPQHAQRLMSALERNDRAALLEEAHKLNGIASLCGFDGLRLHASKLEGCLRGERAGEVAPTVNDLLFEVGVVSEQIGASPQET